MTIFVLDSSAVLRYIDNEPGADRIEEILSNCASLRVGLRISAVQWGEVAGSIRKRLGADEEMSVLSDVLPSEAEIIPATGERAVRAAAFRVDRKIAYADAFALDLAVESPDQVLVTADYGFKVVEDLAQIEFLPLK